MIKYYKELENPNNFSFDLVNRDSINNKKIHNINLPLSLCQKYKLLFNEIPVINILFNSVNYEKVHELFSLNLLSYDEYGAWLSIVTDDDIEEKNKFKEAQMQITKSNIQLDELKYLLYKYEEMNNYLSWIYKDKEEYFKNLNNIFKNLQEEINNYTVIKFPKSKNNIDKIVLPNAWFITPYGDLYNTTGINGHKQSNLIYPYQDIINILNEEYEGNYFEKICYKDSKLQLLNDNKYINDKKQYYINLRKQIINNEYITNFQFKNFLNFVFSFTSLESKMDDYLEPICYNRNILKTVLGIVSAQASFYSFFENLAKYSKDYKQELRKAINLTNNYLPDILVRCCGFYKYESQLNKTFTTSDPYYKDNLREYMDRGYNVIFIPPIQIRHDIGEIKEMDMESPFIKKYIKNI